jgi:hypothetical protein
MEETTKDSPPITADVRRSSCNYNFLLKKSWNILEFSAVKGEKLRQTMNLNFLADIFVLV